MAQSAKNTLKISRIIHWALLAAPVLLGIFVYLFIQNNAALGDESLQELIYLPLVFMLVSIVGGRFLFQKILGSVKDKGLEEKLQLFLKASIVRNALFEMTGLVTAVVAFLTGNSTILLLIPIIALQFITNRPSLQKVEIELMLSREEVDSLK